METCDGCRKIALLLDAIIYELATMKHPLALSLEEYRNMLREIHGHATAKLES